MSPNTIVAYARDLTHFFRFLTDKQVDVLAAGPAVMADFLDHLVRLRYEEWASVILSARKGWCAPR